MWASRHGAFHCSDMASECCQHQKMQAAAASIQGIFASSVARSVAFQLPSSNGCDNVPALTELPTRSLRTPIACRMSRGVLRCKTAAALFQGASSLGQKQSPSLDFQGLRINAMAASSYQMLQNLPPVITMWSFSSAGFQAASRRLSAAWFHSYSCHSRESGLAFNLMSSNPQDKELVQHNLFGALQATMQ